jgi:hypothetical protein
MVELLPGMLLLPVRVTEAKKHKKSTYLAITFKPLGTWEWWIKMMQIYSFIWPASLTVQYISSLLPRVKELAFDISGHGNFCGIAERCRRGQLSHFSSNDNAP